METNRPNIYIPLHKHTKRSSFIQELQAERNIRIANLQKSRRQHSHSTFVDLHQIKVPFTPTSARLNLKEKDLSPRNQQLLRARSMKNTAAQKPIIQAAEKTTNDLNQNMVRLKVQQMTFKYKTKISCLLKELNISTNDMTHFNNINKTEEILNFLSLKVRDKLTKSQISEENYIKNKSKSKEEVKEHEIEIQLLRRKMMEKQNIEKELKSRLRDSQAQTRQLLNVINQKEKELSQRMDEVYQQKMTLTQQQKLISRLKSTCQELQLLNKNNIKLLNTQSNDILSMNKQLEERNIQLLSMMEQLKEQIKQYKEKQNKLLDINRQLSEQVIRWRQRCEDGFLIQHQKERTEINGEVNTPNSPSAKKTIMSMNNFGFTQSQMGNSKRFQSSSLQIQNTRLKTRAQQLTNKNKQLTRDIPSNYTIQERYSQTLAAIDQQNYDLNKGLDEPKMQKIKSKSADNYRAQLQTHYQKKIEEMAKIWKEKLYELVHEYEDQLQKVKEQMDNLQSQKDEKQMKILNLAKQKYLVQTRLIEREREIYDMNHILSINSIAYESKKGRQQNNSNSIILSENENKPTGLLQMKEQSKQSPQLQKQANQKEDKIKVHTKLGDTL